MPHNLRNAELDFRQRSKHCSTAASSSLNVAKKRLCVAIRRASFQTRSMGANCGLYGGRKSKLSTLRYRRSKGASSTAWWYLLPAVVVDSVDDSHPAITLVKLRVGQSPMLARLTRRSAHALEITPGQPLYAQIKAVALIG